MDFPPEVEPGECEAKGEGEEQEPEAFPLEEQSGERGQVRSGAGSWGHLPSRMFFLLSLYSQTCQAGITGLFILVGTLRLRGGSDPPNITELKVTKW